MTITIASTVERACPASAPTTQEMGHVCILRSVHVQRDLDISAHLPGASPVKRQRERSQPCAEDSATSWEL